MYITLEGIDGCGTSTVLSRLDVDAHKTEEPSNSWLGNITRESFENRDIEQLSRFYLFMADRVQHTRNFPDGDVISDRGPDSTRAYQYHTSDLSESFIEENLKRTPTPDLTIWFEVDVDTAMSRLGQYDAFEKYELQRRVSSRYQELYERHDRIIKVDASQSIDVVTQEVQEIINDTLR